MLTTSITLLQRLRRGGDAPAWERFVKLYTPLLLSWARQQGLRSQDAADLVQDVFIHLLQKLPEFTYDRHKSFRGWLKTVTLNIHRDHLRTKSLPVAPGGGNLFGVADPEGGPDPFEEEEHRRQLVRRAMEIMRAEFRPTTWRACWELVAMGRPAAEVAAELGMTENAVYIAKSRVLRRLRQELEGLLD